jgi:hypothetical protein
MTKKKIGNICATLYKDGDNGRQSVKITFSSNDAHRVTIYRCKIDDFVFGQDYKSFFDCLPLPTQSELIFDGEIATENGFAKYCDTDVSFGCVYAYWVECEGEFIGPASAKVRDSRVWWHKADVDAKMRSLADKHVGVEMIEVGRTVAHEPLYALLIGNREKMLGGVGAVHAGESGPEIMLTIAEQLLCESPELFESVGWAILPIVNADMRELIACGNPWYIRKNKNEVDLNRNFDGSWDIVGNSYGERTDDPRAGTYRGPYPNSEPETQAVINFMNITKPIITFSYHWLASMTCDSFLCGPSYDDTSERHKIFCDLARPYSIAFRQASGAEIWTGRMVHPLCSNGGFSEWGYHNGFYALDAEAAYAGGSTEKFRISEHDGTDFDTLTECIRCHKAGIVATIENLAQI